MWRISQNALFIYDTFFRSISERVDADLKNTIIISRYFESHFSAFHLCFDVVKYKIMYYCAHVIGGHYGKRRSCKASVWDCFL